MALRAPPSSFAPWRGGHFVWSEGTDDGKDWYNFFRDKDDEKEIPNPLILYACVVAPFPKDKKIKSEYFITNDDITFPNSNDILKLRYLYLDMNEDFSEINEIETNLELREK